MGLASRTSAGVPTLASVWEDVSGRDLADQGLEWPETWRQSEP